MNALRKTPKSVRYCAVVLASLVLTSCVRAQTNTNATASFPGLTEHLADCLHEFGKTRSISQLEEAHATLGYIANIEHLNSNQHRKDHTKMWLDLYAAVEQHIDPTFDESKPHGFINLVPPPDGAGGAIYPPGTDPSYLKDPKARAEYQAAIKSNSDLQKSADFQVKLRLMRRTVLWDLHKYVERAYTSSERDRKEWSDVLNRSTLPEARKKELQDMPTQEHR